MSKTQGESLTGNGVSVEKYSCTYCTGSGWGGICHPLQLAECGVTRGAINGLQVHLMDQFSFTFTPRIGNHAPCVSSA